MVLVVLVITWVEVHLQDLAAALIVGLMVTGLVIVKLVIGRTNVTAVVSEAT